jgi:hypothetical protein
MIRLKIILFGVACLALGFILGMSQKSNIEYINNDSNITLIPPIEIKSDLSPNLICESVSSPTNEETPKLSASNEEAPRASNATMMQLLGIYIPTAEYMESYAKFKEVSKDFSGYAVNNSFDNSEVDVEWTLRMEDIIYNQIQYNSETGEQRFSNIQFNEVDCRRSMCKLNVARLDLSFKGKQIGDLSQILMGPASKKNANDNRSIATVNHKDGTTSFYFSRSVNDNLRGDDRK